jgi:uncharacterized protein YvpB
MPVAYPQLGSNYNYSFRPQKYQYWNMLTLLNLLIPITLLAFFAAHAPSARAATILPIEFHRQQHSLSCEVASLKTALQMHRVSVTESELIRRLPFDNSPRKNGVWGDPSKGFVGSIDGRMMATGYGVYAPPLAYAASPYTDTRVLKNASITDLTKHLQAGRPVIVWGYYGSGQPVTWKTSSGQTVNAVSGEHTRVAYGFEGPANNPAAIYLMDPIAGPLRWSTRQFQNNWNSLNNMSLVVYPPH